MFDYANEAEEYSVACRPTPTRSKPKPVYSARFDRRQGKPGVLCNGGPRRRNKRNGL